MSQTDPLFLGTRFPARVLDTLHGRQLYRAVSTGGPVGEWAVRATVGAIVGPDVGTTGTAANIALCPLLCLPNDSHRESSVSPWEHHGAIINPKPSHDPGFCVNPLTLCACIAAAPTHGAQNLWVRFSNFPHSHSSNAAPSRVYLSLCSAGASEGGRANNNGEDHNLEMIAQDFAVMQCFAGRTPPVCSLCVYKVTFFLPLGFLENLTQWVRLLYVNQRHTPQPSAAVRFHIRSNGALWVCVTRHPNDAAHFYSEHMDVEAVVRCKGVVVTKK